MDRGYWISWYDLPDEGRADYLSWVHGRYIPRVLERPGLLWAAHYAAESGPRYSGRKGRLTHTSDPDVPGGTGFILLFGAAEPHAFVNPVPADFHAGLPAEDRRMLAMRAGERVNIMTEQARVTGPHAAGPGTDGAPSACVQLGSFNAGSWRDEDELAAWYAQWVLPSLSQVPACVRVRKLVSVAGWAKHAILFEFASLEARNTHFVNYEQAHPEREAWTDRVVRKLVHAPGSPSVAQRLWPPVAP
jgi:hypothetical protein